MFSYLRSTLTHTHAQRTRSANAGRKVRFDISVLGVIFRLRPCIHARYHRNFNNDAPTFQHYPSIQKAEKKNWRNKRKS